MLTDYLPQQEALSDTRALPPPTGSRIQAQMASFLRYVRKLECISNLQILRRLHLSERGVRPHTQVGGSGLITMIVDDWR